MPPYRLSSHQTLSHFVQQLIDQKMQHFKYTKM